MKRNSIIAIMLMAITATFAANAGPARDRAQAVMDGLQGTVVSAQVGSDVLDAFVSAPEFAPHVPLVLVDDELVPKSVWTVEEESQFFLDRMKSYALTVRNRHKISQKRIELQGDQDTIENQVTAVVATDL